MMNATIFGSAPAPAPAKPKKKAKGGGLRIILPPATVTLPSQRAVTHEDTQAVRDVEAYTQARANQFGLTLKASTMIDPTTGLKFRVVELLDGHSLKARLFLTFYAPAMRIARQMLDDQLRVAGLMGESHV